ncbi:unnamed protein product, partial [marine sediment metagenome]
EKENYNFEGTGDGSPIALSHIIQGKIGLEAIFHITCRDRNLLGLQVELLGASALGVKISRGLIS